MRFAVVECGGEQLGCDGSGLEIFLYAEPSDFCGVLFV